ncbi:MAG: chromosomal replication initiator protein DnaA [Rhodobacteraceae bacterium]|nr:chromosomal replication initiator protein DnaA [Paracoccaceae bacterium]
MMNDTWEQVRGELLRSIGKNNFSTWIKPIVFESFDEGTVHFHVPARFIGSWVLQNFGDAILHHFAAAGMRAARIEFSVDPSLAGKATSGADTKAPGTAADHSGEGADGPVTVANVSSGLPGAFLNPGFTFDAFVVGKPNELSHAAAHRVAEGGPITFNPLFIYGGVGLGKTHLMHAIAWELLARQPEQRILYLSAEQFMYRFVRALREKDMIGFKEMFRSVDVLMVDDVQFIAGKNSTQEEFFHTFNSLVEMGKQIVISGDRSPVNMEDLDNRVASRLACGLVVDLHPTDYELRLGILQAKTESYTRRHPALKIAPGVLEFIAQRIFTNVRVLEGALNRLFAFADLIGSEITVEIAHECLTDILRATDRKVTIDEVIRKVCEHYNIRQADLLGPSRMRRNARPRQMAMYLCKTLTTQSMPDIGRKLGRRDHTTILHGVRKIEDLRALDSRIAEDAELLRRMLED